MWNRSVNFVFCYFIGDNTAATLNDSKPHPPNHSFSAQLWHFLVHMRWHYQVFILSAGFLLGGVFQEELHWLGFGLQFLNVHLLLFGGATAYNSFWDRDAGPIGGLKHPPVMEAWMWPVSLMAMAVGLLLALPEGPLYVGVFSISMLFFWLYSTPLTRWKGHPLKSLVAIGLSTGTNSFLLGYMAAGPAEPGWRELAAAFGVALTLLSLYPVSQLFQMREDSLRGDTTFAVRYGRKGVYRFYGISYPVGILTLMATLETLSLQLSAIFGAVSLAAGYWIWTRLRALKGYGREYDAVMRIKYGASLSFVFFILICLLIRHTAVGINWGLDVLFK